MKFTIDIEEEPGRFMNSNPHRTTYLAYDMARTSAQFLSNLKEDLIHSRYFQVYFIGWVIIVIMSLIALGIYGKQTTQANEHRYQESWVSSVDRMSFPKFHFNVHPDATFYNSTALPTISSISCLHNNKTVKAGGNCDGEQTNSTCVVVNGEDVDATPSRKNPQYQSIVCTINVNINGLNLDTTQIENILLEWEIDNPDVDSFGSNSFAPMVCLPNAKTWVLVTPVNFEGNLAWDRQQQFHGATPTNPNQTEVTFYVTTIINSFTYWNWKERSSSAHTGWNTAAYIGGFAFFCYILHIIFMFCVGFGIPNDSLVLGGKKHESGLTEDDALLKHQHNDL